jgi:hypothetical protein
MATSPLLKLCACAVVFGIAAPSAAAAADAAGCQDPPLLPRLAGCTIRECHGRDYDEAELQTGPTAAGRFPTVLLDGRTWIVTYTCPAAASVKTLPRQAESTLRRGGFAVVYSGAMLHGDLPGFTARRGADWIQLVSEPFEPLSGYTVTVVRVAPASTASPAAPKAPPPPRRPRR